MISTRLVWCATAVVLLLTLLIVVHMSASEMLLPVDPPY
jgi:hypothetical protein